MNKKSATFQRLPEHLKGFIVSQNYEKYTPRDHSTWRFFMRNARDFFKANAHHIYLEGLSKTGIPISSIPKVDEMDSILNQVGWGAVCVCGFIPPLAFLEFQANQVLPIAADMRTLEHLAYTPAPDIVHEAAGHAPIIADPGFSQFLKNYALLAKKAIFSKQDIELYEAIRALSDIKENPDSSPEDINNAELDLEHASKRITWQSEAAKVARLYWWTAEYGLVGDLKTPKIFGAGLLSSLGEGHACLKDDIKKIPLSLACIEQSYDITKPQPQLYVAKDFAHLNTVLKELENKMSFKIGGIYGLKQGIQAKTLSTTVLRSGLQISGIIDYFEHEKKQVTFVRWRGPVQLSYKDRQLEHHGRERHPSGFSAPLGAWVGGLNKAPSNMSVKDLRKLGLELNKEGCIKFVSGITVKGTISSFTRIDQKLLMITWQNCTVSKNDTILFAPEWGEFDLAIEEEIASVYGGPADWSNYGDYNIGQASTIPGRKSPYSAKEKEIFSFYQKLRDIRNKIGKALPPELPTIVQEIKSIAEKFLEKHPEEWLLGLEIVELKELIEKEKKNSNDDWNWLKPLTHYLLEQSTSTLNKNAPLIKSGIKLVHIAD